VGHHNHWPIIFYVTAITVVAQWCISGFVFEFSKYRWSKLCHTLSLFIGNGCVRSRSENYIKQLLGHLALMAFNRWRLVHSNSRFESVRFDSLYKSTRINSVSPKNRTVPFDHSLESVCNIWLWLYCQCYSSRHKGRKNECQDINLPPSLPHFSSLNSRV